MSFCLDDGAFVGIEVEFERKDGDSTWLWLGGSACSWTTAEREGPCWCRWAIGAVRGRIALVIEVADGRKVRIVLCGNPDMLKKGDIKW